MKSKLSTESINISPLCELTVMYLILHHFGAPDWAYWVFGVSSVLLMTSWFFIQSKAKTIEQIVREELIKFYSEAYK